ncbi:MAG: hypothetical protein OFPI_02780 [Osedax symbiont Rs2]|nr:MAG: hypothetical protein OFPI_02780 [Osedax symbiont Rs2]
MKENVDPTPLLLLTEISPSMSFTSCLHMTNPRPLPPYFLVVELSA